MSRDIREYWRQVREVEDRLPEFVWVVSTADDTPGFVTEVPAILGARLLQAKSHRLATNEEVEAHYAQEAAAVKDARREKLRRSGSAVVVVEESPAPTSEPSPRRRR